MKLIKNPNKMHFDKPEDKEWNINYILWEILLLKNCYHPNVLKFKRAFMNSDDNYAIVTEYSELGSL